MYPNVGGRSSETTIIISAFWAHENEKIHWNCLKTRILSFSTSLKWLELEPRNNTEFFWFGIYKYESSDIWTLLMIHKNNFLRDFRAAAYNRIFFQRTTLWRKCLRVGDIVAMASKWLLAGCGLFSLEQHALETVLVPIPNQFERSHCAAGWQCLPYTVVTRSRSYRSSHEESLLQTYLRSNGGNVQSQNIHGIRNENGYMVNLSRHGDRCTKTVWRPHEFVMQELWSVGGVFNTKIIQVRGKTALRKQTHSSFRCIRHKFTLIGLNSVTVEIWCFELHVWISN